MTEVQNFSDPTMNDTETTTPYYFMDYTEVCGTDDAFSVGSYFKPTLFSTVFVLGLIGNCMVLWILIRFIKLKTVSDICLLNLAISDLMVVLSLPIWVFYTAGHDFLTRGLCKTITGVYQAGFYSGILFVTLMSVDRYLAIVHAVATMRVRTLRFGVAASVTIWIVSFCGALPEVIFHEIFKDDDTWSCQPIYPPESKKTWELFRNFRENVLGLFVALPIMMYCYVSILAVLLRSRNSKRQRAIRLIFTTALLFAVFWVPYNAVAFLKSLMEFNTCETTTQIELAVEMTETIALTHCCVNPVIYAFVGEKFWKYLNKMFSSLPLCSHLWKYQLTNIKISENETSKTPL